MGAEMVKTNPKRVKYEDPVSGDIVNDLRKNYVIPVGAVVLENDYEDDDEQVEDE